MTIASLPNAAAGAPPPAFDYVAAVENIRKLRAAMPVKLRADFDQTLKDLAEIAKQDIDKVIHDTATHALGGLVGGVAATAVSKVVNAGIDNTIKTIEAP